LVAGACRRDPVLPEAAADSGTSFRISDCQYVYNLPASSLGTGHYRVDIVVNGAVVGRAEFSIK